ncbi:helix-turn-helix domain-containing protein [Paenibacillus antri]|nr:AraC family transcriptional regulator [Paenibacillus antri]
MPLLAPSGAEFAPVVGYANRLVCTPSERFGPRAISDFQFVFVASGAGRFAIGGRSYRAAAGCLFFYGPDVPHVIEADDADPFVLYGVHFIPEGPLPERPPESPLGIRPAKGDEPSPAEPGLPFPPCARTGMWPLPYFETFAREFVEKRPFAPEALRGAMLQFAARLLRWCESGSLPAPTPLEARIAAVRAMLEERAGSPYDAGWLTEASPYTHDYVSRKFRERFGAAPQRYHDERRVEQAMRLLATSADSVTDAARRLGFDSVHYFCRWFKSRTGEQPSVFRQRNRTI